MYGFIEFFFLIYEKRIIHFMNVYILKSSFFFTELFFFCYLFFEKKREKLFS